MIFGSTRTNLYSKTYAANAFISLGYVNIGLIYIYIYVYIYICIYIVYIYYIYIYIYIYIESVYCKKSKYLNARLFYITSS